jgi:hypothetical protein
MLTIAAALLFASGASAFDGAAAIAAMDSARAIYDEPPLHVIPYSSVVVDDFELYASPDAPQASVALSRWPALAAALIDPRTTTVGVTPGSHNGVDVRLSGPTGPPPAALIAPQRYDPGSPLGLSFISPAPLTSKVTLTELRGSVPVSLPVVAYKAALSGGAQLVQVDVNNDDGLRIAYGASYRLDLGGTIIRFHTSPLPTAFLERTWTFDPSMTATARAEWARATGALSPQAERVLNEIDGAVTVSRRSCGGAGEGGDSCATWVDVPLRYTVWISPYDFSVPEATRFVALHELGHIVEFLGIDGAAYEAFRTLFAQSPSWRTCFPDQYDGGCVPLTELFADQFAYWATGLPHDPEGGYGDPPLATTAAFGRVLAQQFAFRPPYWRNPARSDNKP